MLERKRARANQRSEGEEKRCAPRATWTETQSKGAESAGEGGRRRGGIGPRGSPLPGPPLGRSGPSTGLAKRPPGRLAARAGSQLHLGSRRGLKNRTAGAAVWKQGPCGHQRGAGPVHRNLLQGMWVQEKKKSK